MIQAAQVGAFKRASDGDNMHKIQVAIYLLDHGEEAPSKHDIINLKYGRDFLQEIYTYDIVVVHNIFHTFLLSNAEIRARAMPTMLMDAKISPLHDPTRWRHRLVQTGAKWIFVFHDQAYCLDRYTLGDLLGYKIEETTQERTIYRRSKS